MGRLNRNLALWNQLTSASVRGRVSGDRPVIRKGGGLFTFRDTSFKIGDGLPQGAACVPVQLQGEGAPVQIFDDQFEQADIVASLANSDDIRDDNGAHDGAPNTPPL